MSNKITGKEYPLSKIFSKEFDYYIPTYQRPYAWTEKETEALFDDLISFFKTEANDNFFLGSIVLIKEDETTHADVIDGQQRLTTLTILLAVMAYYLSGDNRTNCNKYLMEPGNELEGLSSQPRLHLRPKDQSFFNKYIQDIQLDDLIALDEETLANESQKHIRANCALLKKRMEMEFLKDSQKVAEFCKFVVTRCYLVAVYTSSKKSAFRVFSVMNSRGLNLMPIDIFKSDIIGLISEEEQQEYTDKWEDLEVQTTRSGLNDVFTHTRMIFAHTKAKQSLLEEFRENVLSKTTPKKLIDEILEPYAEVYTILVNKKYVATQNAEQVNQYLFWLNKIDNSDWMPSAIKFMAEHQNASDYVLWFIRKLERLAAFLHITAKDVNHRIERYKSVLEEMEQRPNHNINNPLTSIELTNQEKQEFVHALDGNIYELTAIRRNFVILRLNAFVSDGATNFDFEPNILTIEHVLPQTVTQGSEWDKLWPDVSDREKWLHRIANLVPLTRKKNSEAQNYAFDTKKDKYFKGQNGTTTYPLTTQVISESTWTPEVVSTRQKTLLNNFKKGWDLNYIEVVENKDIDEEDNVLFYIKNKRGASAIGYKGESGFVVKASSKLSEEIVDDFEVNYPNAYRQREILCKDGTIIDGVFQANYEFDSISLAASVVLGRNARGQKEWVDSNGIAYDEKINTLVHPGQFTTTDDSTSKTMKAK